VNDKKEYKISVTNDIVGLERVPGDISKPQDPVEAADKLKKEASSGSVGKTIAVRMGQQALSFAVSNYGNLTGDYITQEKIQAGIEIAGTIAAMAFGGPVGIMYGISNIAIKAITAGVDKIKQNREVDFLRARTGMIGYSGGRH